MDLSLPIDVVENISERDFKEKYFDPQIPVVMKGLTNGTFAGQNWNLDYFKRTMGHHVVPIYDNKNPNRASAYTTADLHMKFGEFLDNIQKEEGSSIRMFLFDLFKLNPKLSEEFPTPRYSKGLLGKLGRMFFAPKNTTVRIHYDIDLSNVFHTNFGGKKRVVLFSPVYNSVLYKLPHNTYSLVNVDKPDYEKYPALRYAKGYDFVIGHGDTVFMPSGYWHYMTYLETSFSVSYRKMAQPFPRAVAGFLNITVCLWFDKFMNKMLGPKWLEKKERKAAENAEEIMREIERDEESQAVSPQSST